MAKEDILKKEEGHLEMQESMPSPIEVETRAFLKRWNLGADEVSRFLYIVSTLVNFFIYRSVKERLQLPAVRFEEEEKDKNRMEAIFGALNTECIQLGTEFQEVIDELVSPMAESEAVVGPILKKIYKILESLVPSDDFRQAVENQIEDSESWGDNLTHYEDREEDYFEVIKRLFALDLEVVESSLDGELQNVGYEEKLQEIKTAYEIEKGDFEKLKRRATEFFMVAFATYLEMDFQPVRDHLDAKIHSSASEERKPAD